MWIEPTAADTRTCMDFVLIQSDFNARLSDVLWFHVYVDRMSNMTDHTIVYMLVRKLTGIFPEDYETLKLDLNGVLIKFI